MSLTIIQNKYTFAGTYSNFKTIIFDTLGFYNIIIELVTLS